MRFYPPEHYDDRAQGFTHIRTRPLASAMGAEILDVDLGNLSDAQFEEIRAALFRHKMIYFRGQDITLEDQEAFTLRFGPFGTDAYTAGIEGHPNVQRIIKEADTVVDWIFGDGWHTDSPFLFRPPAISILYGRDIPPYGGDTWWSNTELARCFLSKAMQDFLAGLQVHMSAAKVMRNILPQADDDNFRVGEMPLTVDQRKMVEGAFHPLIRTHPDTGARALYLDQTYSMGIRELEREEADALLAFLQRHVTREEFCCRLRWEKNTLVVWDNRLCIHKAFNDYDGFRREMIRTIVDGEVPQ